MAIFSFQTQTEFQSSANSYTENTVKRQNGKIAIGLLQSVVDPEPCHG
jgi:hypothetical protein